MKYNLIEIQSGNRPLILNVQSKRSIGVIGRITGIDEALHGVDFNDCTGFQNAPDPMRGPFQYKYFVYLTTEEYNIFLKYLHSKKFNKDVQKVISA